MTEPVFERLTDGYVAMLGGAQVAVAYVEEHPDHLVFTHTEVEPGHDGEHLGTRLAEAALDDVRERGLRLVPRCPFIAHFVDTHPAYADLVM